MDIDLPQEVLAQLKSIQALIELKELEMAALRSHMAVLLREAVGVDTTEGDWVLDLDSGTLRLYEHTV